MPRLIVVAALWLTVVPAAPALAQSVPMRGATAKPVLTASIDLASTFGTTAPQPPQGAYERPSAGNRKIAIYRKLHARGLLTDEALAEALSRYNRDEPK